MNKKHPRTKKELIAYYTKKRYVIADDTGHSFTVRREMNHILHILLSLLTFWILGGWLWIYLPALIFGGAKKTVMYA